MKNIISAKSELVATWMVFNGSQCINYDNTAAADTSIKPT